MIIHVKKNMTMKKTYITPTLWVEKIQLSQFVCVSGQLTDEDITEVSKVGAKGGWDMWTDDEPEEVDY